MQRAGHGVWRLDDIFIARFTAAGDHVWSKGFGDAGNQNVRDVAIDGTGAVVVTGYFESTVDLGGGVLTSGGTNDILLGKFRVAGAHVWSKSFGDNMDPIGYGIAVDGVGNIVMTGRLIGSADFGGGPIVSGGANDAYLVRLDPAGGHLSSQRFGDALDQYGRAVAVDSSGKVLMTGRFHGAIDFGAGALTSAGGSDVFLARFAP